MGKSGATLFTSVPGHDRAHRQRSQTRLVGNPDVERGRCDQRADRSSDSIAKQFTAQSFYRIHNAVADVEIPADVGGFRLIDRVVVAALNALPEGRRFMKGLFAWLGFRTATVDFRRDVLAARASTFRFAPV